MSFAKELIALVRKYRGIERQGSRSFWLFAAAIAAYEEESGRKLHFFEAERMITHVLMKVNTVLG